LAARCAADEAISAATKALELCCSLVALDREWRREHEQNAKTKNMNSPRVERDAQAEKTGGQDESDKDGNGKDAIEKKEAGKGEDSDSEAAGKRNSESKRDRGSKDANKRLSDIERIKQQHISLRVKNLQCLGSLNEEVLQLQGQLRGLFKRSEGGLLPEISLAQKDGVFELVKQLLNSAFNEAGKLASDASVPVKLALEKPFAFALALEHTPEVALSAEVRTHVLKLAALVDLDLLSQIIDGPFRSRLLGLDVANRRPTAAATVTSGFPPRSGNRQSARPGIRGRCSESNLRSAGDFMSWGEAVHSFCDRLLHCLPKSLDEKSSNDAPHMAP
jgi:hypothetical protein